MMSKLFKDTVATLLNDDGICLYYGEPDESPKEENRKEDAKQLKKVGYNQFMLEDVWKVECIPLKKANLKKVRKDAHERITHK